DKQAEHVDSLGALGFGFIELGGVTPRPQAGNPKPRLFRLPAAQAIINRYGLNSVGVDSFVANLSRFTKKGIVGVNIGKNKDTPNEAAAGDYELCLEKLYPHVDYVTLNVSSPNTAGLRELQEAELLAHLLSRVRSKRERLRDQHGRHVALALKIAPDLTDAQIRTIATLARREQIDGIVATNTSVARDGVMHLASAQEQGGLSGAPLRERSTHTLKVLAQELQGEIPLIGVGGILSGADAVEKLDAGASLVQIYTGLIYRGPELINECVSACLARSRTASSASR
ncbi:MAG: dihydroorotate dehydrogenase (quinone), partial [Betaproteobacteria bacterium]|nr:dihydroorotate dehydrogenase (quinone) [Betaproteobacteria bacterium]